MKEGYVDKIMAVSAVVVAVAAVVIAVYELHSTREYQRLSVQPYLEMGNDRANGYEFVIINNGLGPAKIMGVEILVEGEKVSTWKEVTDRLLGTNEQPHKYSSLYKGRQIKAAERVTALRINSGEMADLFHSKMGLMDMKICYCSIYQECWIRAKSIGAPNKVSHCPKMQENFPLN